MAPPHPGALQSRGTRPSCARPGASSLPRPACPALRLCAWLLTGSRASGAGADPARLRAALSAEPRSRFPELQQQRRCCRKGGQRPPCQHGD